jgi:hypothetical protein
MRWFGLGRGEDFPTGPGVSLSLEFGAASNKLQRAAAVAAFRRSGLPEPREAVLRPPLRGLGPAPAADLCVNVVHRQARGGDAHRLAVGELLPGLFEAWSEAEKRAEGLVIRRLHVTTGRRETYYAWRRTDSVAEIERGIKALVDWDHRAGHAYGWEAETSAWNSL